MHIYNIYLKRVTKMIAIKTADLTQNFKEIANQVIAGETVVISRPKNENIVLITEKEYNDLNKSRKELALERFRKNMQDMQNDAIINGTSEMSMDEIDILVAEAKIKYGGNDA